MRDRLFRYLQDAGRPLPAAQILREVLNIVSPNTASAHKLLQSIVTGDSRFRSSRGLWSVRAQRQDGAPLVTASLFVEQARGSPHPLWVRGAVRAGGSTLEFGGQGPVAPAEILRAARAAEGRLPVVWNPLAWRVWQRALEQAGSPPGHPEAILISHLVARTLPGAPRFPSMEDVAAKLGIPPPDPEKPASAATFVYEVFNSLLERIPPEHRADAAALKRWVDEPDTPAVDFSRFAFGPELLDELPETSGVYVMRDPEGGVIYVGKGTNLRRRVRSYFARGALGSAKNRTLHRELHSLEVIPTESEVEALILEMRLIRELQPRVNVQESIHESQSGYGRERNLLLLVPHRDGDRAAVYFLKEGLFVDRLDVALGREPTRKLAARLRRVFYGRRKLAPGRQDAPDREILFRWLSHNRRDLNYVDIDDAGCFDSALRCVADYLRDPGKLKTRVFYR